MSSLTTTHLPGLSLLSKGKVRDIYSTSSPNHLLFVATDRISAYDVILKNGIPDKGKLLTKISCFWFDKLKDIIPNHFVTASVDEMPEEIRKYKDQLDGRAMLVRKAKVVPLEAIVRGYITGSAWSEYKKHGTVHGIPLPEGLAESSRLPEPLFTPSTKAEQGAHDENISPDTAAALIGTELYNHISRISISLYTRAAERAYSRGVILADTKFEFGLISPAEVDQTAQPSILVNGEQLILVDEVLTPDSSRYWPLASYTPGQPQPSFDKQFVRDWLVKAGFKKGFESGPPGKEGEGWEIDEEVVLGTKERYEEAVKLLMS
ncbi:Bifunctional purine biosynthetic protein ade1 [Pleurotus ostreatus]|uniref:Phosphoribosylaminoimidazole-succinocarboxamide synthase n=1 Tax=Pleurotus ostreatus TaxID=5322 RepID=A0A8H6ZVJ8_PLEOS|nr:Bifunctional purine biosynthetic protein ade1 [Pleurotus ostreatus]KAF7432710.1 Bifunctional purine biosynthetic protein ade1 [Pleurotus ostreatus]KAJ8698760.1 Bifunctional purine biosynthetic protein ade1 [Pleurotus ostreatus]